MIIVIDVDARVVKVQLDGSLTEERTAKHERSIFTRLGQQRHAALVVGKGEEVVGRTDVNGEDVLVVVVEGDAEGGQERSNVVTAGVSRAKDVVRGHFSHALEVVALKILLDFGVVSRRNSNEVVG